MSKPASLVICSEHPDYYPIFVCEDCLDEYVKEQFCAGLAKGRAERILMEKLSASAPDLLDACKAAFENLTKGLDFEREKVIRQLSEAIHEAEDIR